MRPGASRTLARNASSEFTPIAGLVTSTVGLTAKAQSGVPDYAVYEWNGVLAPAGLPAEVASRIETELRAVLQDPAVRKSLQDLGAEPVGSSATEFKAFIDDQMQRSAGILARAGITKE